MLKPESSQLSFYGDHIYDRVIPDGHFLKQLEKAIDFSFVNDLCRDVYNPDIGRPAYEPQMMFKMQAKPEHTPDKDARYGYKTRHKPFLGYKAHADIDADSELITRVETTPGNVPDGDVFGKVVNHKSQMVTADKAYDSEKNHRLLKEEKKRSAIITKKNRKSKRLKKNRKKADVQAVQRERPKVERKFAELKRYHGLAVARYWGLTKMAIQSLMAAITCNLKRILKLIVRQNGKAFVPIEIPGGIPVLI